MSNNYLNLRDYTFEKNDFIHYFKNLYNDRGIKAFYQLFNRPHRRSFSRSLIQKYSPTGAGIEIGVGARTIAPTNRTVLSDVGSEHGVHTSIAKVFFDGSDIPYEDKTFSFLLSEHVLEHITDPIKILKEWTRVLSENGHLYLVLPHRDRNNDCHREITTLEHLIKDYENHVAFNDEFHFNDWWTNVVEKNLMPGHYQHLEKKDLLDTCSIHHHVWNEDKMKELLEYLGLEIVEVIPELHDRRDSFAIIAKRKMRIA
jgi:SAM-dependent methyltransferase